MRLVRKKYVGMQTLMLASTLLPRTSCTRIWLKSTILISQATVLKEGQRSWITRKPNLTTSLTLSWFNYSNCNGLSNHSTYSSFFFTSLLPGLKFRNLSYSLCLSFLARI